MSKMNNSPDDANLRWVTAAVLAALTVFVIAFALILSTVAARAADAVITGPFRVSGIDCGEMTLTLGENGVNSYAITSCDALTSVVAEFAPLDVSIVFVAGARVSGNYAVAGSVTNNGTSDLQVFLAGDPADAIVICESNPVTAACLAPPVATISMDVPSGGRVTFSGFGYSADPTEVSVIASGIDGRTKSASVSVN